VKRKLFPIVYVLLMSAVISGAAESDKSSDLLQAAKDGNLSVAQTLLIQDADPNTTNVHGISALMMASQKGHTEIVKLLLDKGAV